MKSKKPMWFAVAGIVGCGLCAVPVVFPLVAGALGFSVLGFSVLGVLVAVLSILLAVLFFGVYLPRKKMAYESDSGE